MTLENTATENAQQQTPPPAAQSNQTPPAATAAQTIFDNPPPQQQVEPQGEMSRAEEIQNTINSLGNFMSPATKAELEKELASIQNPAATTQPAAEEKPAAGATQTPPVAAKKEDPANTVEENGFKSKLGLKRPGAEKKETALPIENMDQLYGEFKSKLGIEIKAPTDIHKSFEVFTGWRKDSEKLKTVESTHQKVLSELEALPEEFHDAFQRMHRGEDWREAFAPKSKFDFNIPAEKQDKRALVDHYYPGKFTDADFSEAKPSDALEIATEAALNKFSYEKQTLDQKRATQGETAKKQLELYKQSVGSSVSYLKQNFPDTEEDTVKSVSSILEGGPQKVVSFFFNGDGSVKQEAAESLMMAMYGKEEITGMMQIAQHSKETELNEEILSRGADTPKPVQRVNSPGAVITESEKQKIEELNRLTRQQKSKTY